MLTCRACGAENPNRARFCLDCGTRLVEMRPESSTSRRTVTILFSDIVGSTELGEQLDPEALRTVLSEYFTAMRSAIERHAGTVEKYIGDAIMAVFGMGAIHEDDALRAVRAAAEMRDALVELNLDLQARRGVSIVTRTGLNTGEVVAGDPSLRETMVTGDTVNTAARLEQAAGPAEILLGMTTWQLVRHVVTVEQVRALPAKGKAEPIPAVRLVAVSRQADPSEAWGSTPMVGREHELERLAAVFNATLEDRTPARVTILGPAGVGKSRLTGEFVAALSGRAMVLRGHCLPYGEGVTYWPVREILHAAAGIRESDPPEQVMVRLRRLLSGTRDRAAVTARLGNAIGLTDEAFSQEEIFWAVRRTLEHLAARQALVIVIDDIHWAEPTLVELIGYLLDEASDVPLLMVCPARPEFLDAMPERVRESPRASTILLDGLTPDATAGLIDALPGGATIPAALRERILATVEGNPLFLEEMVRMVVEDGLVERQSGAPQAGVNLPPTIQALLAARVDQLPTSERSVAQRASIAGRVFDEVAVVALTPPVARPEITVSLMGLVRRELIAPERSELTLADAYRFRHILLRDAAYEGLPKAERADLHRRFADWLEQAAGERLMEYEEILGYHLGQAYRYRVDLRDNDALTTALGKRAARHLGAAGKRANDRGDVSASIRLLGQAEALPSEDGLSRTELLLDLGLALQAAGSVSDAGRRAAEALALAEELGDRRLAARSRLLGLDLAERAGALVTFDPAIRSEIAIALADAEAAGDELALAEALAALSSAAWNEGEVDGQELHLRAALEHARAAGNVRYTFDLELNLLVGLFAGPTPASEVVAQARELADRANAYPTARAEAFGILGVSEAMLGRFEDGHRYLDESIATLLDLANYGSLVNIRTYKAWIHRLAGDYPAAEAVLREALAETQDMRDLSFESFVSCRLAEVLVAQGRYDEAADALIVAERSPIGATQSRIIGAHARIDAARGDPGAAQAVEQLMTLTGAMRWLNVRAEALRDAAHTMRSLGDTVAARKFADEGARLSRAKENVSLASQLEQFAEAL